MFVDVCVFYWLEADVKVTPFQPVCLLAHMTPAFYKVALRQSVTISVD